MTDTEFKKYLELCNAPLFHNEVALCLQEIIKL